MLYLVVTIANWFLRQMQTINQKEGKVKNIRRRCALLGEEEWRINSISSSISKWVWSVAPQLFFGPLGATCVLCKYIYTCTALFFLHFEKKLPLNNYFWEFFLTFRQVFWWFAFWQSSAVSCSFGRSLGAPSNIRQFPVYELPQFIYSLLIFVYLNMFINLLHIDNWNCH